MVRDKKFAAAAIIGFIAAVLLFCVAMTLVSDAEVASSASTSDITEAFTTQGNYVMVLIPDSNTSEPFVTIRLCTGNVIDQGANACHEAIPLPVPLELRP
jgi:hypothetical protein